MFTVRSRKTYLKLLLRWIFLCSAAVLLLQGSSTDVSTTTTAAHSAPSRPPPPTISTSESRENIADIQVLFSADLGSKVPEFKEGVREVLIGADLNRVPVFGEVLSGGVPFGYSLRENRLGFERERAKILLVRDDPEDTLLYVRRQLPPHPLDSEGETEWQDTGGRLQKVEDFFHYLKAPPDRCHKTVTLGGRHRCGDFSHIIMDGAKVVCLDPPLDLPPGTDPHSCLTLSFGIHIDSSFDTAISDLNCEVHMFDLLNYTPTKLLNKSSHAFFHQVGLSANRQQQYYVNIGRQIPVDTLVGILINNSLIARPINILKVDIEGNEWDVFEDLSQTPIMDIIGQIAIEIHNEELITLPTDKHQAYVRRHYDILRAIERRGFKKAAYWANDESLVYTDPTGTPHYTCGEIHYFNSNWFNTTFKTDLKDIGIKFK